MNLQTITLSNCINGHDSESQMPYMLSKPGDNTLLHSPNSVATNKSRTLQNTLPHSQNILATNAQNIQNMPFRVDNTLHHSQNILSAQANNHTIQMRPFIPGSKMVPRYLIVKRCGQRSLQPPNLLKKVKQFQMAPKLVRYSSSAVLPCLPQSSVELNRTVYSKSALERNTSLTQNFIGSDSKSADVASGRSDIITAQSSNNLKIPTTPTQIYVQSSTKDSGPSTLVKQELSSSVLKPQSSKMLAQKQFPNVCIKQETQTSCSESHQEQPVTSASESELPSNISKVQTVNTLSQRLHPHVGYIIKRIPKGTSNQSQKPLPDIIPHKIKQVLDNIQQTDNVPKQVLILPSQSKEMQPVVVQNVQSLESLDVATIRGTENVLDRDWSLQGNLSNQKMSRIVQSISVDKSPMDSKPVPKPPNQEILDTFETDMKVLANNLANAPISLDRQTIPSRTCSTVSESIAVPGSGSISRNDSLDLPVLHSEESQTHSVCLEKSNPETDEGGPLSCVPNNSDVSSRNSACAEAVPVSCFMSLTNCKNRTQTSQDSNPLPQDKSQGDSGAETFGVISLISNMPGVEGDIITVKKSKDVVCLTNSSASPTLFQQILAEPSEESESEDEPSEESESEDDWDSSDDEYVKKSKKREEEEDESFGTDSTDSDSDVSYADEFKDGEDVHEDHIPIKKSKPPRKREEKFFIEAGIVKVDFDKAFDLIFSEKNEQFTCQKCGVCFESKEKASKHMLDHRPFKCSTCEAVFSASVYLTTHMRSHGNLQHCSHCSYATPNHYMLVKHQRQQHKLKLPTQSNPWMCDLCGFVCNIAAELQNHLEKEHNADGTAVVRRDGDMECPFCPKILSYLRMFQTHLNEHLGFSYNCSHNKCSFKTFNHRCFLLHKERHIDYDKWKYHCEYEGCEVKFSVKCQYIEHINAVHIRDRRFKCTFCTKAFLSRKHLIVHLRMHSDKKPVACDFCDYRCRQRAALNWHMKKQHPEKLNEYELNKTKLFRTAPKIGRKRLEKPKRSQKVSSPTCQEKKTPPSQNVVPSRSEKRKRKSSDKQDSKPKAKARSPDHKQIRKSSRSIRNNKKWDSEFVLT